MIMVPAKTARFLFAGGGTGGHLYPAIAIAQRLSELLGNERQVEIHFVGTRRGIEYRMRESIGFPLELINVRGLARTLTLKNLLVPFLLIGAMIRTASLMKKYAPHVVIGTGGYVALPVLQVAAMKKIPTVLQEQNSFPGITTRKLAGRAQRVYLGFEKAGEYLNTAAKVIVTGNPVRRSISHGDREQAARSFKLEACKRTILVLGGSQGARGINEAVLTSLKKADLPDGYQLLWQTGKGDYKEVTAIAGEKAGRSLFPFATDMASVYAAADVVVARAGAISLAEIQACELPSILIPYPYAAGDHQRKNAEECVRKGYADMIDEKELAGIDILKRAVDLIESGTAARMKTALKRDNEARKPAVDLIAEDIINLLVEAERREASVA